MADATVKREIEDEETAGDASEAAAADLQTSPAQAAGRRTRKPVQPLGGVVTRRTSARQVASSASRGNAPTDSGSSPRQASRATRQAGPRTRGAPAGGAAGAAAGAEDAAAPAAAATSTPASSPRKGGWKRKKSLDTDELSTSEPEMEHDDSDSDPVWVPGAASSAASKALLGDSSSTAGDGSVAEPAVKVARRGKPAKGTKGKAGGARKGAAAAAAAAKKPPNGARSEAEGVEGGGGGGGGGGGRRGAARKAVEAPPSIDLAASSEVLPESLQLKVQVPGEGEESTVKRDYTRRPSAAANAWRMATPMMLTVTEASPTSGGGGSAGGELQPGDYIMAMADVHRSRPPIWRIEGRTLLQRFEVIETGEETLLYRNSSSFSAWNPLEQSKYADITVRVHSNSRNATVVEVLEIHAPPNSSLAKNGGPEARSSACGGGPSLPSLEEPFEVYLQTLLSHVLDPNFLAEVHRENDEYFLANLQTVDGENERRAARLRRPLWNTDLCRALATFPRVHLLPHSHQPGQNKDEGGGGASVPCEGCSEGTVARVAEFSGEPYNKLDLSESPKPPVSSVKEEKEEEEEVDGGDKFDKRTFLLCASCAEPVPAYSQLHHYKLHAFHCCRDKIERLREDEKVTESHIILERCLQDDTWVNKMYADLQKLWRTCVPESS